MSANSSYEDSIKELGFEENSWLVHVSVLFLLFVAGFIGNITVLTMLLRKRLVVSSTIRHLILNLVIADLFVVVFCILTLAIWEFTVQWLGGDLLCRLSKLMQMFSLYASTFIVVVISVDRCCAIVAPISRFEGKRYNQKMIGAAWLFAFFFSIPQAVIFKVAKAPMEMEFYQCVTFGSYTADWQEPLYTSFTLLINFIAPLTIIIVCYALILQRLFGHSTHEHATGHWSTDVLPRDGSGRSHANPSLSTRYAKLRKARTTSFWITILIVMTFVVCWGPYYVRMVGSFIWEKATDEHIDNYVFFFGMSNSVINPLIYGAFHILGKSRKRNVRQQSSLDRHNTNKEAYQFPLLPRHGVGRSSPKTQVSVINSNNVLHTAHYY